ncbi:MAG: SagB/ThcOx family dehydrogenase [Armatimonadota bacterium]|nr:MAG: SagB/ThcOx family dehydrogenase [Armatimonadota bacterium]
MKAKLLLVLIVIAGTVCLPGGLGCGQPTTPRGATELALPPPSTSGEVSVEQALGKRRSIRQFRRQDLTLEQIGQLAWAAQGITKPDTGFRTAPSAGALYPLELYLLTRDGVFRYVPKGHKLVQLAEADKRGDLARAALGQPWVSAAPLDFVISGVYARTRAKYGDRAERYVILEAGHVAQNIHLQAVALGLGSVPVGAYTDEAVSKVLDLSAEETPLYIIPVGYPAG